MIAKLDKFGDHLPCPYVHNLNDVSVLQVPEDDSVSDIPWRVVSTS